MTAPLLSLLLAAACALPPSPGARSDWGTEGRGGPRPLVTIARLEERGSDGDGLLEMLLAKGAETTRARAARALGRLPAESAGERVRRALALAARDDSPRVRAEVAFALGQLGTGERVLGRLAADPAPLLRTRAVDALTRLGDLRAPAILVHAFTDKQAEVRASAAVAAHRLPREGAGPAEVEARLARLAAFDPEPAVRRAALFTLSRRASRAGRGVFLAALADEDRGAEERLFAALGLAALEPEPGRDQALARALDDPDWRVAVESARGLARVCAEETPAARAALLGALARPEAHVRSSAALALGAIGGQTPEVSAAFEALGVDPSREVRAAAIEAETRALGARAAPRLEVRALERDPVLRAAVARAARSLPAPAALPLLRRLAHDADPLVAWHAIESLGAHLDAGARETLREFLQARDPGRRLGAVIALGAEPTAEDLPALARAYRTTEGEIAPELRYTLLEAIAPLGAAPVSELLLEGARDPHPHVRRVARRLLHERGLEPPPPPPLPPLEPGPAVPLDGPNPRVAVDTSRGTLEFELLREVAPVHVENFLRLAESGHYDGLRFHRVVPDFVVQGGDLRGDGNGGVTWRGRPLRREFSPLSFERGSLGMPLAADPDGGGSQWFVTHRWAPHLDGRYTLFGRLLAGGEVLDTLEVDDRILGVRRLR